jgi:integrase
MGNWFSMARATYTAYDHEGRRKYLTHAEGKQFLRCARRIPRREALFCLTIHYTGIRISEALAITRQDIDPSSGIIRVRTLKKRQYHEFRRIPIPGWLSKRLLALEAETPQSRLWPFSRTTGWRVIKRVMAQAEISGVHATTKGLRHAFGVRGVIAGVPLTLLQELFGHSQIETTSIYLDVKDSEKRTLMRRTWK